jgi:hypothetical protein
MLSSDNLINSAIRYNSTNPQNLKPQGYTDYDILDFVISAPGQCLVGNSVRLLFDVKVLGNDTLDTLCSYDGYSGGHAFIESVTTSTALQGNIETIRFYARQVACRARAILAPEDLFSSHLVAEGRCNDDVIADKLLKGFIPTGYADEENYNPEVTTALDVCLRLDFCLNSFVGDNLLSLDRTGAITVSISLPRSASALYGNSAIGGAQTYLITNPKLLYNTIADTGKNPKQNVMQVRSDFKQSINSSFVNINTTFPITANAFYLNFIRADKENNNQYNSQACEVLPAVSRVSYIWNNSFSQAITYELDNVVDFLANFKRAINGTLGGDSSLSLVANSASDSFGLGLQFGTYVDLRSQRLSINIESAVQSGVPYTCYVHATGIATI